MTHPLRLIISTLSLLMIYCPALLAQQLSITSATPNPVCAGSSITTSYTYSAGPAGTLYLVLNGPATTNLFISAAPASGNGGSGSFSAPIPADRTSGTYTIKVLWLFTGGAKEASPINDGFTVNARPSAPGVSNLAYCLGATGVPPLTATGQNLIWYPNASGGGGTTATPTPPTSTTGTTNYYVSQTVNGCESASATLPVTINRPPVKPTVISSLSYCQGSIVPSLAGAVTSGSNLKWYGSELGGGNGSTVAPVPSTSTVGSITYYVSQTNFANQTDGSACESERSAITVTTKAKPATPSVTTPVTYCQDITANALSATPVSGGTLNWYGPSNNALGSTAPTPPTTAPGTTFYSVSQTFSGCESAKATIQVTVNTRPVAPTTMPVSVCQNTPPVSLTTGVSSGSNLKWYTNPVGGSGAMATPTPPTTAVGQTPYYVTQTDNNGCESYRAVLTFIVNAYPTAPAVSSVAYCQNATATSLTATPSAGGTLNFYLAPTGGSPFSSLTPSTSVSKNYYVSQSVNGCESSRAVIAVSIRSLPPSPAVTLPAAYCQFATAAPLSATANTNFSLNWYGTNSTGGTASTVGPTPTTSSAGVFHYYVSQSVRPIWL